MPMMNRCTDLVNKIEVRLGTRMLNLPQSLSKDKWMDTIIKKVAKQKKGYCLYKDKKNITDCALLNNYTIKPISINNNYLLSIQNRISNGNIFMFKYSKSLEEELVSIIRFINSKGYDIKTLKELLKE